MTCKDFLIEVVNHTSSEAKKRFKEAMCSSNTEYTRLGHEAQEDVIKVTSQTDKGEVALVDFFNDGLVGCKKDNKLEFVWSKDWPGHNNKIDLYDGDIYLIDKTQGKPIFYFDLKVAEKRDYNTTNGVYIGGNIGERSLSCFPSKNHMYILSTYDGSILTLLNGVQIRALIHQYRMNPIPSDWKSKQPYFTVYHHIRKIATLNKNVWIIRNESNKEITCFN